MRYGIALGSNVGDRLAHLRAAMEQLAPILVSPVYETEPVDCAPDTPMYLNAVVEIESELEPEILLQRLQQIEQSEGRPASHGVNEPRTLDLDLLYAADLVINTPTLTLPHPRMTQRRFVLQPLADIRPDLVLPGCRRTVAELLADVL